jgi:hypothetical protein
MCISKKIFPIILLINLYCILSADRSCDYWELGMKGSKMDNNRKCPLKKPTKCDQIVYDNLFDLSAWLLETCESIGNNSKQVIQEYTNIKSDFSRIAYPKTTSWGFLTKSLFDYYRDNIQSSIKDISDYSLDQIAKEKIEIWVDFPKTESPKVNIHVRKEEELAEQRKQTFSQNHSQSPFLFKNIFILFVDSVSRNHFRRKLPKLYSWLEKFYIDDTKSKHSEEKYESFQFFKYHGTGTWTNANLYPFFFGKPYTQFNGQYVIKYFKNKGYITGSITNQCSREFVDIHNESRIWTNWDHEFTSLFCDPNFANTGEKLRYINGPYGVRKKCLYNKPTLEYAIEYTKQFMDLYKDQAKVVRIGSIDGHEGSGEPVKYNDELFYEFVLDFEKKGYLDDTLFIVLSDHAYSLEGFHVNRQSQDHYIEKLLPYISFIIPKNTKGFQTIRENLKFNENSVFTPYDMHSTLVSLLNDKGIFSNDYGSSIIENKLDRDHICRSQKIKPEWCRCSDE